MKRITTHQDLEVYQLAFAAAMEIFEISKKFPKEEKYSLTDQIRRSSRSVCANLAEAFRKRRYPAAFIAKLSDAEAEAAETQVWLEFMNQCNYSNSTSFVTMTLKYEHVIGKLVNMLKSPENWKI